jgi:hypothetical protein
MGHWQVEFGPFGFFFLKEFLMREKVGFANKERDINQSRLSFEDTTVSLFKMKKLNQECFKERLN